SRRRHTRFSRDWSSDVCSSDLKNIQILDENIKPIKQNVLSYSWDKIDVDNYYLDVLLLKDNQNNFGILDETGRTIIPFEFEELRSEERRVGKECKYWLTEK